MAKSSSGIWYFLGITFALWYVLSKTQLGSQYSQSMMSVTSGFLRGAGEGLGGGRTIY